MVKKKDEKKGKIDFVSAQSSRNPILENSGMKSKTVEDAFSDVKTGHCTRDTEHQNKEIGPGELARASFQWPVAGFQS